MPGADGAVVEARRERSRTLLRIASVIHSLLLLPPVAVYSCAAICDIWNSVISDQPLVGCCTLPVDQYRVLRGTYRKMSLLKLKREALLVPLKRCRLTVNDSAAVLPQRGLANHEVLSLTMPPDSFKVYERARGSGYVVCKELRDRAKVRCLTAALSVGTLAAAYCTVRVVLWSVRAAAHPPPRSLP
ncbi:uncharacterized protein LOC144135544 [Amblyomma americanum]